MTKRIFNFLLSSPMMIILLVVLAIALGAATFIEERFDTETANQMVYHAKWFEFLFLLLILNLIGHIKQYNLLKRKKWAGLTFHVAFIVIIIGAGITRYFGFEGQMHIREGKTTNILTTSDPNVEITLPFSLQLRDFILERYPGSMSPSSYASEVTLIDPRSGLRKDYRIFMNNVLDYDKYRFFQSSYDTDEMGTVLSVNHDYWGTRVTYLGYSLLCLGFLLTLFNPASRFLALRLKIREIRAQRKSIAMVALMVLGLSGMVYSQNSSAPVPPEEADKFGHLLVQTTTAARTAQSLPTTSCINIQERQIDILVKDMNVMQVLLI
jgi:cytochrome c biogenesis protein ResB